LRLLTRRRLRRLLHLLARLLLRLLTRRLLGLLLQLFAGLLLRLLLRLLLSLLTSGLLRLLLYLFARLLRCLLLHSRDRRCLPSLFTCLVAGLRESQGCCHCHRGGEDRQDMFVAAHLILLVMKKRSGATRSLRLRSPFARHPYCMNANGSFAAAFFPRCARPLTGTTADPGVCQRHAALPAARLHLRVVISADLLALRLGAGRA
jgi:hypothetical protein